MWFYHQVYGGSRESFSISSGLLHRHGVSHLPSAVTVEDMVQWPVLNPSKRRAACLYRGIGCGSLQQYHISFAIIICSLISTTAGMEFEGIMLAFFRKHASYKFQQNIYRLTWLFWSKSFDVIDRVDSLFHDCYWMPTRLHITYIVSRCTLYGFIRLRRLNTTANFLSHSAKWCFWVL